MANIDKIKEQGNQAAPLLTELHDNELVISGGISGAFPSLSISNLKGRQNIISYLDKFEKGEIKAKDIDLKFTDTTLGYQKVWTPIDIQLYTYGGKKLIFRIIHNDIAAAGVPVIIEFTYSNSSGEYELSVKAYKITDSNTKHDVTAEFTD